MPIKEARAADVAAMKDRRSLGVTILATRRWLRVKGLTKNSIDFWIPDLGPSLFLLEAYRKGDIDWTTFAERYKAEQQAATTLPYREVQRWYQGKI